MIYKEEVRDLFTVPQGYILAHCISGDFNLGGGIAKQFCEYYNMKEKLISNYIEATNEVGEALPIENVYNLVTKGKVYEHPTYDNLRKALIDMKDMMVERQQLKLAMPKIGCGLDGLDWNIVRAIIKEVFEDIDIEILICVKDDDKEELEEDTEENEINKDFLDALQFALDVFGKK